MQLINKCVINVIILFMIIDSCKISNIVLLEYMVLL